MSLDLNIYTILETCYKQRNSLPSKWNKILDIKLRNELISKALNTNQKIEDLEIYKQIIRNKEDEWFATKN